MKWYKTLSINQKINLKEFCPIILGIKFEDLGFMFSFKERINIIYNKLQNEGFEI